MARFTEGWIRLERRVVHEDIGENGHILAVWITLLCWACRFETKINFGGKQRILPPGSCVFGVREMATHLGFSKDTVYRALSYLKMRDTVRVDSATSGTVVTICNWERYQPDALTSATPMRHELRQGPDTIRTPSGHHPTLNEQGNKETKKQKNKKVGILTNYPPAFVGLWESYGKIGDKKRALDAFEKLALPNEQVETLKTAVKNYYDRKPEWQNAMHFSSFLNGDWRQYLERLPERIAQAGTAAVFDFLPHRQAKNEQ